MKTFCVVIFFILLSQLVSACGFEGANPYAVTASDEYRSCTLTINPTSDTSICIGNSVNLAANASGGTQPYTYEWSDGYTTASHNVSPFSTSYYTVTVTDA